MIHALAFAPAKFIRHGALSYSKYLDESAGETHEKFSGHVESHC